MRGMKLNVNIESEVFVSKSQEKRVKAQRAFKSTAVTKQRAWDAAHETRMAIIMKPFPQINIHRSGGGWYGVSLTQRSIDTHRFLHGVVPMRRNAN